MLHESIEGEIARQISLLVDAVKMLIPSMATMVIHDVCKAQLQPFFKRFAEAVRERPELDNRHLLTVIVKLESGTLTYNIPGVDSHLRFESHWPPPARLVFW